MKILQIASHDAITRGGAVQVHRLAGELVHRGHEVVCVFNARDGSPAARNLETIEKVREAGAQLLFHDLGSIAHLLRFRRYLRRERFDVVHSHRDAALRFATLATLLGGPRPPVFVTNRGTTYPLRPRSLARWLFRRPGLDRVVAVAEAVKQVLVESGPLPAEKVDVIYGSVDVERFRPGAVDRSEARRSFGIEPDAAVVGTVASWAAKKGYDDFFKAAALLARTFARRPGAPPLRILAAGERVEKKTANLIDRLGIRDLVRLPGHVEDVPRALVAMDVFVCASTKGEGLTGSVREALAMETPVVSTDVSGNGEIVRHETTGLLVPIGDPTALHEATRRLLDDHALAASLARAGRRLILESFTDEIRGERIERLYREILQKNRP